MKDSLTSSIRFVGVTHRGCVRNSNEDCMLLFGRVFYDNKEIWLDSNETSGKSWLCAVADGIGGSRAGEIASQYVLEKLSKIRDFTPAHIERLLIHLNQELIRLGNEKPVLRGLGTTVAGLGFNERSLFVFNVGDARVYRVENKKLMQLTVDDNLAGLLKEQGIKMDKNREVYLSSTLTQSIGGSEQFVEIKPHLCLVKPRKRERFLLCTDGLNSMVAKEEMEEIINSHTEAESIVKNLLNRAIESGGRDNITIIFLEINFS